MGLYLCPVDYDWNDMTCARFIFRRLSVFYLFRLFRIQSRLKDGQLDAYGKFPRFLYAGNRYYEQRPLLGFMRGELLVMVRLTYTSFVLIFDREYRRTNTSSYPRPRSMIRGASIATNSARNIALPPRRRRAYQSAMVPPSAAPITPNTTTMAP